MNNNVIIGTAGHVDHGKTCLIKALTGIDTDRLKEEKKRGITIELGFAYLNLEGGRKVGIIDVPGHEKFVKNMLAGAGGIDIALLVVAANEGIMPQTREHFEILKLLNLKTGVIALTKADMVDKEWIDMVKDDIRALTAGSFLENAAIVETSVYDGTGIEALKSALITAIDGALKKDLSMPFRIPIDRIFSVDGFGTVITGTLIDGTIEKGDTFAVYPTDLTGKVRNIQVHDTDVDKAFAGQRAAINLSGIKKEELKRGYVIAQPESMENSYIIDVKLNMLADTERIVKNGSRLHFYHGSRDVLCKIVLLDRAAVKKGESCYAQLRLEEQVCVKYKDNYIVRFYSPLETVGGGTILNPLPRKHAKNQNDVVAGLKIMESGTDEEVIFNIINEKSEHYPAVKKIETIANMPYSRFMKAFEKLRVNKEIVVLADNYVIGKKFMTKIGQESDKILAQYHKANPFKKGMNTEEYKSRVFSRMPEYLLNPAMHILIEEQMITMQEELVKRPKFKVQYSDEHIKIAQQIEKIYLDSGFLVPARDDVLKYFRDKNAPNIMNALISDGTLKLISKQMLFHKDYYKKAIHIVKETIQNQGQITLGEFRDQIGASRKYAVSLLEHFDQKKITKLVGGARILA